MSALGKKVVTAPAKPPAKAVWRPHKPGFEIGPDDKLRTVDIDTATREYLESLRKRTAP